MRRTWLALAIGCPLLLVAAYGGFRSIHAEEPHASIMSKITGPTAAATAPPPSLLAGLDLTKITPEGTAPLANKKVAHLTIDPALQKVAEHVMASHHIPEASVVLMDVGTGKILVYANHVEKGPPRDLAIEATAPAASVFKIVTASTLVDHANLAPDTRACYSGGEQKINEKDLVPDAKKDKWCTTLAGAMGRSLNTVFARAAITHLKPPVLEAEAKTLGFGASQPFDVAVQSSQLQVPEDQLGFARTAAGFWHTTLSPIHAAWLSSAIAREGEPVRPVIVNEVWEEGAKKPEWTATVGLIQKRILEPKTAKAVTTMLESTVSDGTCYKAFHDSKGKAFLPGIDVAGKTGTLTDAQSQRFYTWFTGFAPVKPLEDKTPPKVAIAVLVVNDPTWTVKANVVAREVMRAYFASKEVPGVTAPKGEPDKTAKKDSKKDRERD